MKPSVFLAVALFALSAFAADQGKVLELTYSELSQTYKGDWLLVLYAPWCGHCRKLEPLLPQISSRVGARGTRVAKVNADDEAAVQVQFGVNGFPTILHLHDGEVREYDGQREVADISSFVEGGWRSVTPASPWLGPTSVVKRGLGIYAWVVLGLYARISALAKSINMQPIVLASILGGAVVVVSIAMAVCCAMRADDFDDPKQPVAAKKKAEKPATVVEKDEGLKQRKKPATSAKPKKEKKPQDKKKK